MTEAVDREKLRELVAKATPRPWFLAPASVIVGADGKRVCLIPVRLDEHDVADSQIIVAAVNALTPLLDQLDTLTQERDEAREALEGRSFDAAQFAADQRSDEPLPGDWNDACIHIAEGITRATVPSDGAIYAAHSAHAALTKGS